MISTLRSQHFIFFFWLQLSPASLAAGRHVSGKLPFGHVVGQECLSNPDVVQYLGIPYGRAPVGELRFRPPLPYDQQFPGGVLVANQPPPSCPQVALGLEIPMPVAGSEDCLFINLWAPASAEPGDKLPVRVYIHGGAWAHGSASDETFNGCQSVNSTQSILVTMQYRLGPLGFLAHPGTYSESNSTGNWGVMDQQMALRWIQDHINAFGGDPSRVLLFGQSAGAWSVALHVSLQSSAGLFSAAASESVPGWDFGTPEQAYKNTWFTFTNLGCPRNGTWEEQLTCFRDAPVSALLAAVPMANLLYLSEPQNQMFSPVLDGTFLPCQIVDAFESGHFNKVPYVLGGTANEGLFMLSTAFRNLQALSLTDVVTFIETVYPGIDYQSVLQSYPEADYAEFEAPIYRRFGDIWTDVYMTCPLSRAMTAMWHHGVPLYRYHFTHAPSCPFRQIPLAAGGVLHDDDNFYVFNQTTNLPPPNGNCNFTEAEKEVADMIVRAWTSMARRGAAVVQNGAQWQPWDPQAQSTLVIATPPRFDKLDFGSRCSVYWDYVGVREEARSFASEERKVIASVVEAWPRSLMTP